MHDLGFPAVVGLKLSPTVSVCPAKQVNRPLVSVLFYFLSSLNTKHYYFLECKTVPFGSLVVQPIKCIFIITFSALLLILLC